MINDTITYPRNQFDDFCNVIIKTSNELSKDIGISYGEFWVYILLIISITILFYILLTTLALFSKYRNVTKILYWISISIIIIVFWNIFAFISTL